MKTNVIRIEKNIPMPEPMRHYGSGGISKFAFIKDIEIGDSFLINGNTPDYSPKNAISTVYSYAHKLRQKGGNTSEFRVACRILRGNAKNPLSVRIWRTA